MFQLELLDFGDLWKSKDLVTYMLVALAVVNNFGAGFQYSLAGRGSEPGLQGLLANNLKLYIYLLRLA